MHNLKNTTRKTALSLALSATLSAGAVTVSYAQIVDEDSDGIADTLVMGMDQEWKLNEAGTRSPSKFGQFARQSGSGTNGRRIVIAQGFTSGISGEIVTLRLPINCSTSPVISIVKVNADGSLPALTANALDSVSPANITSASENFATIDLTAGKKHNTFKGERLAIVARAMENGCTWKYAPQDGYAGGSFFSHSSGEWRQFTEFDLAFATIVKPTVMDACTGTLPGKVVDATGCLITPANIARTSTASESQEVAAGNSFGVALEVTVTAADETTKVSNAPVTFTVSNSNGATATLSAPSADTDINGIASIIATAGNVPGSYTVTARIEGVNASVVFMLENLPAESIFTATDTTISTATDTDFNLVVMVTNQAMAGKNDVRVEFSRPDNLNRARAIPSSGFASTNTNENGIATIIYTANAIIGEYTITATANVLGVEPIVFNVTNVAPETPAGSTLARTDEASAALQMAIAGNSFGTALAVTVTDGGGNVVPGIPVSFTAPTAGPGVATVATTSATADSTDADGVASINVTAGNVSGAYAVTASVAGVDEEVMFMLENLPAESIFTAVTATSLRPNIGDEFTLEMRVTAQDETPKPDVRIFFTVQENANGARVTASGSINATTGEDGVATITLIANATAGTYTITATASVFGVDPIVFQMRNVDPNAAEASGFCFPVMGDDGTAVVCL